MAGAAAPALAAEAPFSSLKFKDTEIATVLKAIEKKASQEGRNITIVTTPEVFGLVTVDLENVNWKTAFKVILKMYDLGYIQDGNILTVSSLTKIHDDQKKEDEAVFASGGMKVEAFKLKHVEAADVAKMIQPFLSKEGKVSVLDVVNKQGWGFSASTSGTMNVGDNYSSGSGAGAQPVAPQSTMRMNRTKILAVSDTPAIVRQIAKLIDEVDVAPKQILIRAVLLEVGQNTVYDLGLDFGSPNNSFGSTDSFLEKVFVAGTQTGFQSIAPNAFVPPEGTSAGVDPYSAGLNFSMAKVKGTKFQVILHALQEDERTNTLSTPTILTMDGREATILVGTQFPIIETNSSTYTDNTVGGSLSFYQNIGIQLRVVPQIVGEDENMVNLLVHPTVSNQNGTVSVSSGGTADVVQYPIIETREAETQMVVNDGDTIVLGGLLSDAKTKEIMGVPFLSNIPLIGKLFDRDTKNSAKTDLLIFLTVRIVRPAEVLAADVLDRIAIDQKAKIA
jgi:type IV pilus secretin PilQ/predicted competence protein